MDKPTLLTIPQELQLDILHFAETDTARDLQQLRLVHRKWAEILAPRCLRRILIPLSYFTKEGGYKGAGISNANTKKKLENVLKCTRHISIHSFWYLDAVQADATYQHSCLEWVMSCSPWLQSIDVFAQEKSETQDDDSSGWDDVRDKLCGWSDSGSVLIDLFRHLNTLKVVPVDVELIKPTGHAKRVTLVTIWDFEILGSLPKSCLRKLVLQGGTSDSSGSQWRSTAEVGDIMLDSPNLKEVGIDGAKLILDGQLIRHWMYPERQDILPLEKLTLIGKGKFDDGLYQMEDQNSWGKGHASSLKNLRELTLLDQANYEFDVMDEFFVDMKECQVHLSRLETDAMQIWNDHGLLKYLSSPEVGRTLTSLSITDFQPKRQVNGTNTHVPFWRDVMPNICNALKELSLMPLHAEPWELERNTAYRKDSWLVVQIRPWQLTMEKIKEHELAFPNLHKFKIIAIVGDRQDTEDKAISRDIEDIMSVFGVCPRLKSARLSAILFTPLQKLPENPENGREEIEVLRRTTTDFFNTILHQSPTLASSTPPGAELLIDLFVPGESSTGISRWDNEHQRNEFFYGADGRWHRCLHAPDVRRGNGGYSEGDRFGVSPRYLNVQSDSEDRKGVWPYMVFVKRDEGRVSRDVPANEGNHADIS